MVLGFLTYLAWVYNDGNEGKNKSSNTEQQMDSLYSLFHFYSQLEI